MESPLGYFRFRDDLLLCHEHAARMKLRAANSSQPTRSDILTQILRRIHSCYARQVSNQKQQTPVVAKRESRVESRECRVESEKLNQNLVRPFQLGFWSNSPSTKLIVPASSDTKSNQADRGSA